MSENKNIELSEKQKEKLCKYFNDEKLSKEIINKFLKNEQLNEKEEKELINIGKITIIKLFLQCLIDDKLFFGEENKKIANFLIKKFEKKFYFQYIENSIDNLKNIIKNENYELIELLIDNINNNNNKYFVNHINFLFVYHTLESKKYNIFNFLITKGININACNNKKETVLSIMIKNLDCESVKHLVEKEANIDLKTVIMHLVETVCSKIKENENNKQQIIENYIKIGKYLISEKSNTNLTNEGEIEKVLMLAIKYESNFSYKIFDFLENNNINNMGYELSTLIEHKETEILELFLKKNPFIIKIFDDNNILNIEDYIFNFIVNTDDFSEAFKTDNYIKEKSFESFFKFLLDTVIYSKIPDIIEKEEDKTIYQNIKLFFKHLISYILPNIKFEEEKNKIFYEYVKKQEYFTEEEKAKIAYSFIKDIKFIYWFVKCQKGIYKAKICNDTKLEENMQEYFELLYDDHHEYYSKKFNSLEKEYLDVFYNDCKKKYLHLYDKDKCLTETEIKEIMKDKLNGFWLDLYDNITSFFEKNEISKIKETFLLSGEENEKTLKEIKKEQKEIKFLKIKEEKKIIKNINENDDYLNKLNAVSELIDDNEQQKFINEQLCRKSRCHIL